MMADDQETIGDFVQFAGGLWLDPTALIGGRVINAPSPKSPGLAEGPKFTGSLVQLLMMEAGWVTVAHGSADECDVILRRFLLTIYNERR